MESAGDLGPQQHSQPSSPTHAAHTLASIAQQQVLSAETIVPWNVLQLLIDDYFHFIHPIIPVPHEPTFRASLERREDMSHPTFLALLASMVGTLVACFPRRPRTHFRDLNLDHLFPNSWSLVERCHKVTLTAQGPTTHNRILIEQDMIHDAIINYLQGLMTSYMFSREDAILYFRQGLMLCDRLGVTKATAVASEHTIPRMVPNGQSLQGPQSHNDLITLEMGRRIFWLLFTAIESTHQLGYNFKDLGMPLATRDNPYPPFPLEVDDAYLSPSGALPQPTGHVSELVGFNANLCMYLSYHQISHEEEDYGADGVFDWDRQKRELGQSLANLKRFIEELPPQLQFNSKEHEQDPSGPRYPSPGQEPSLDRYQSNGNPSDAPNIEVVKRDIQKANIYANQLGTRAYLLQKYLAFDANFKIGKTVEVENIGLASSLSHVSPSLSNISRSILPKGLSEADVAAEGNHVIKDFLRLLSNIKQINMEPNGMPLIHKLRTTADSIRNLIQQQEQGAGLGDSPDLNGHADAFLDRRRAQQYLEAFGDVLGQLENAVPPNQNPSAEDDESQLKQWALWSVEQEKFESSGGWVSL